VQPIDAKPKERRPEGSFSAPGYHPAPSSADPVRLVTRIFSFVVADDAPLDIRQHLVVTRPRRDSTSLTAMLPRIRPLGRSIPEASRPTPETAMTDRLVIRSLDRLSPHQRPDHPISNHAPPAPIFCRQLIRSLLADAERAVLQDVSLLRERIEEILRVLTQAGIAGAVEPVQRGGLAPWQARLLERHIADHIGEQIRLADLAGLVGLSTGHFGRAFKITFGSSPHPYILQARIAKAKAMMLERDQPVSQIALDCGFCDQAHFSRIFRRITGEAPCAWRRGRQAMMAA
jgi:AraC family transcriptional regulator